MAVEYALSLTKDILQQDTRKALIDNRRLDTSPLNFFDLYDAMALFSRANDQRIIKWAVLSLPKRERLSREFETLAINRGYAFKGFLAFNEAEEWLVK